MGKDWERIKSFCWNLICNRLIKTQKSNKRDGLKSEREVAHIYNIMTACSSPAAEPIQMTY